ncbi:dTMP kinase [Actinomyces sp.]
MAARGMFITFEGGDGSGKSTQIQSVRDWFESRGREVIVTREPGGTELGTEIRRLVQNGPEDVDARTEALLYAADRAYHVATVIRPALERGAVVLGDRYIDSSLAYQGAARSLGVDEIASLSAWATQGLYPSLTFLLDLPPEVGARRRTDAPDRMERESMDFHERVRHEYLRLADAEPERIVVIDAVGTVDEVFSEIRGVLVERFDGGSSTIDEAVDGSAGSVTAADTDAEAPAEAPAESEDAAPEVASPEASTDEAPPADAPEASAPGTTDEETATDEAAPVLVDAPASIATRKRRAAKASHKGSTEKRSSRKPATMVGALGESQGALWDE